MPSKELNDSNKRDSQTVKATLKSELPVFKVGLPFLQVFNGVTDMTDRLNEEVSRIRAGLDATRLGVMWRRTVEHYFADSQKRTGIFNFIQATKSNNVPPDWVIRLGYAEGRISWCGDEESGVWALNVPRTMMCRFYDDKPPDIEWRLLVDAGGSAEKAKALAEEYIVGDLAIDKAIIEDALSYITKGKIYTRITEGGSGNKIELSINCVKG